MADPSAPGRPLPWFARAAAAVTALALFVLALEVLKASASGLGPLVRTSLSVDSPSSALGFGWVLAYVVLSGSPVAAIALTFYSGGILSDVETFVMIAGSRLGASFVVLVIGLAYHLRGRDRVTSLQMGILSLLVTYAVYLPAIPLGLLLLASGFLGPVQLAAPPATFDAIDLAYGPVVAWAKDALHPVLLFLTGIGVLLTAFQLFDRALPDLSRESPVRDLEAHVFRPSVMFLIGLAVTTLTLSVSVSLSILVPLSAKGIARRENVIPYIMGANVTTFVDTLLASILLGAPGAFTIVLVEMATIAAVSVAYIAFIFEDFERVTLALMERILATTPRLAAFMIAIVVLPLLLILLG